MKIERTIIDKLGLKMYDKVSAVVAELISNSYDADAEHVTVNIPLGKSLATKKGEKGFVIEIIDDGHGMTPVQANDFYLKVGIDRRKEPMLGAESREKHRPVMGRKGIGKLAPFGVCKKIEIRSAGGEKTDKGYLVSHFQLDYDHIIQETADQDDEYRPRSLDDDGGFDMQRGTLIRLTDFLPRNVPVREVLERQLSQRFLPLPDFKIAVVDSNPEGIGEEFTVGATAIPVMEGTKVSVDNRPILTAEGLSLPVRGWIGLAQQAYKNVEFAGVRIYARGKLAAITRDFGAPAGFAGEYVARSYLVGEIIADWLDDEDDLIQTDRQDILWSSDKGNAFSAWGLMLIKEVARKGREPHRKKVRDAFIEISNLDRVARERFRDDELSNAAVELGGLIGGFASEEELADEDYVKDLSDIILAITPHKLLLDTFREIEKMAEGGKVALADLAKIFKTSRIAQIASLGQIADEKVRAIDALEKSIRNPSTEEADLQKILTDAPWLIRARWEPLTSNQSLANFAKAFEDWYKKTKKNEIEVAVSDRFRKKRPDLIMLHQQYAIQVIEIKPPGHVFGDNDFVRLNKYDDALQDFFSKHEGYLKEFPGKYCITLIADEIKISDTGWSKGFESMKKDGRLVVKTWEVLLNETKMDHQAFVKARHANDAE